MINGPKISVVTPSYNQANYLETCLRSVSYQSYRNIEHIVVDGGSSDGSQKILEEYQKHDARLHFSSGPDDGQGDAVNKGFSYASGDIIAWINSDDYYFDTEVFKFVVEFFDKNPDIDIIYGGMAYMDDANVLTHVRIPPAYNYAKLTRISYIGNTNTFMRRKVINRHILDPDCHYVIDHEYMLRITKDFKAYRTKRMIACFRVHPEAKTQVLSIAFKDAERLRRNKLHGIKTGIRFKFLVLWDRIFYRLSLLYTDYKFIDKFKNDAPFNKFTK